MISSQRNEFNYGHEYLAANYQKVRKQSETLCAPLEIEDFGLQAMPEASPPKWHLAHITWFFETFLLKKFIRNYRAYNPVFEHLFNSYYNGIGWPFLRAHRGFLSRPTVQEVYAYRQAIDQQVLELIENCPLEFQREIEFVVTLGLHHEQQHQELLLTDIKFNFSMNPLHPIYQENARQAKNQNTEMCFLHVDAGLAEIGYGGPAFAFDNEKPRHEVIVNNFKVASRLINNAEYLEFIQAGGYQRPEYWLSDGWATVKTKQWAAPLYWLKQDDVYSEFTLSGLQPLDPCAPVTHVSLYEADAFASWRGARLLRESEWECLAQRETNNSTIKDANFVETNYLHPQAPRTGSNGKPRQLLGDVWEWTQSPYAPYPGFKPFAGAIGEYNGKFMCNQMVLRGGSCVTPREHIRVSYRNFFYPAERWQFTGIRLAGDAC